MTYLLDTDCFTLSYYGKSRVAERVERLHPTDSVGVPVVTRLEVLQGRITAILKAADSLGLSRAVERLRSSEAELATFELFTFNTAAEANLDRLLADKKFRKIRRADLLTACIALATMRRS